MENLGKFFENFFIFVPKIKKNDGKTSRLCQFLQKMLRNAFFENFSQPARYAYFGRPQVHVMRTLDPKNRCALRRSPKKMVFGRGAIFSSLECFKPFLLRIKCFISILKKRNILPHLAVCYRYLFVQLTKLCKIFGISKVRNVFTINI